MLVVSPNRTRAARRAAFTLMEVLVVVAIVVILASVGTLATMRFLDDAKVDTARNGATQLVSYAKVWTLKKDERLDESRIGELAAYAENGPRALLDPWQQPYILTYKVDAATGTERIFIYTTNPKTGEIIGSPRELEKQ